MRIAPAQTQSNGAPRTEGSGDRARVRSLLAFTLIEVLITITIFSILIAAINGLLFGAINLQTKSYEAVDAVLPADRAAAIIKRDVMNLVFETNGIMVGSVYGGNYTGTGQNNLGMAGLSPTVNLSFYAAAGIIDDDAYHGDIVRVDYSLQTPLNPLGNGRDLVRTVSYNPLVLNYQERPETLRLLQNVESLSVSFFDTTNWVTSWGDPNGDTPTNTAPAAINVRVEFSQSSDRRQSAPLDLLLPITVSLVNTNYLSNNR